MIFNIGPGATFESTLVHVLVLMKVAVALFKYSSNVCTFKWWALDVVFLNCGQNYKYSCSLCSGNLPLVSKGDTDVYEGFVFVSVSGNVPWPQQPSLSPQDLDLGAASLNLRMNTQTQSIPEDKHNYFSFK